MPLERNTVTKNACASFEKYDFFMHNSKTIHWQYMLKWSVTVPDLEQDPDPQPVFEKSVPNLPNEYKNKSNFLVAVKFMIILRTVYFVHSLYNNSKNCVQYH